MPIKYPEISGRIKGAMADNGITVGDIKERLNISYEMARRYTLGQALPRPEKMNALAKILNVDAAILQYGSKPAENANEKITEMSLAGWPFSVSKQRFDRLPKDEKVRIDGLIEHTIAAWENKHQTKSRGAS